MTSLYDSITDRDAAVADTADFIEQVVSKQSGLKGAAVKSAYAAAKKADSDVATKAARRFLPQLCDGLDQLWQAFKECGQADFGQYLVEHKEVAVNNIMAVADGAAESNSTANKMYGAVRGTVKKTVEEELPQIGSLAQKHSS